MSGYLGNPDASAENMQAMVDNGVGLARMMLPKGESRVDCLECGEDIPEARRKAMVGCKYCIQCQSEHDHRPKVRVVTYST